jgi:putative restriction endonuclease
MKAYVGVTDQGWYEYLSKRPEIGEVNFWRPYGSRAFRVLAQGEAFLFKTKFPHDRVVGGGIYEGFVSLPISRAWDFFGVGNGVDSLDQLIERLCRITGEAASDVHDREIGCILLRNVMFLGAEDALPSPHNFARNIVQGKGYEYPNDDSVVDSVVRMLLSSESVIPLEIVNNNYLGPTHGSPRLMTPRLGQNGFKAIVQEAYIRRCAITHHKILPTLQAAHILPIAKGGQHRVDNGILLRSDVHTLFDRGYLGVDQEFRLCVSPRIRTEFGNGNEFYANEGTKISLPVHANNLPSLEFLSWHFQEVFH